MKKTLIIAIPLVMLVIGIAVFTQSNKDVSTVAKNEPSNNIKKVNKITHGHGLALTSDSKLYVATHHGLLMLEDDKDLYQVGTATDDYMGFSPHPTDPKTFFSSGHPSAGGNIGFQKSVDGGLTWQKISDGLNGPVDFHAMTISPANPNIVYGSYQGAVQRSTDSGNNWERLPVDFAIVNFAADPTDENIVYVASPQGLFVSKDKALTWKPLLEVGTSGFVSAIAIDPQNSKNLLAFADDMGGLIQSTDGGSVWKNLDQNFEGETPLYIAFNKALPNVGYILTEKNSIYKTTTNGISWSKIR